MEINEEVIKRFIAIHKMSTLDPECYFLVCKEERLSIVRFEDKKAIDKEIGADKGRYSNHVGYYKNGKYCSITKNN